MPTWRDPNDAPAARLTAGPDYRLAVQRAVRDLPDEDRHVVFLRFYQGLTQSEIAERMGTNQVQIPRRLRRICTLLASQLHEIG